MVKKRHSADARPGLLAALAAGAAMTTIGGRVSQVAAASRRSWIVTLDSRSGSVRISSNTAVLTDEPDSAATHQPLRLALAAYSAASGRRTASRASGVISPLTSRWATWRASAVMASTSAGAVSISAIR